MSTPSRRLGTPVQMRCERGIRAMDRFTTIPATRLLVRVGGPGEPDGSGPAATKSACDGGVGDVAVAAGAADGDAGWRFAVGLLAVVLRAAW